MASEQLTVVLSIPRMCAASVSRIYNALATTSIYELSVPHLPVD